MSKKQSIGKKHRSGKKLKMTKKGGAHNQQLIVNLVGAVLGAGEVLYNMYSFVRRNLFGEDTEDTQELIVEQNSPENSPQNTQKIILPLIPDLLHCIYINF